MKVVLLAIVALFLGTTVSSAQTYKGSWTSPRGGGSFFTLDFKSKTVDFGGYSCIKKKKLDSLTISGNQLIAKVSRANCGTVTIKIPVGTGQGSYSAPALKINGKPSPETGTIYIKSVK